MTKEQLLQVYNYDPRVVGPWRHLHNDDNKSVGLSCVGCHHLVSLSKVAKEQITQDTPCPECGLRRDSPWRPVHWGYGRFRELLALTCKSCSHQVMVDEIVEQQIKPDTPCPNCGAQKTKEETREHKDQ